MTSADTDYNSQLEATEQQHVRSMHDYMRTIAEATQKTLIERLEASEARNAALESRLEVVEKQAAAAQAAAEKKENKFATMAPALLAMGAKKDKVVEEGGGGGGGGGGISEEERAVLVQMSQGTSGLADEIAELRASVLHHSALIKEVHDDLHHMAELSFEGPDGGKRVAQGMGAVATPEGFDDLPGAKRVVPPAISAAAEVAEPAPTATATATSAPLLPGSPGSPGSPGGRVSPALSMRERGETKIAKLEAKLASFQIEVEGALEAAGLGGKGGGGMLSERLSEMEKHILAEVRTVATESNSLRTRLEGLDASSAEMAAELAGAKGAAKAAVEKATALAAASVDTAALEEVRVQLKQIEEEKATRHEFDALGDAVREVRAAAITGGGGGDGDRALLTTLQAAQQSTQGHVLSLQTHLRALLRRAETEKAADVPAVDMAVVDGLRQQVHEALHELQAQVSSLSTTKADADKMERALETKAERRLMAQKADRAFCEALLARFAVEVGRQLGDMEQSQLSIKGSLEQEVVKLMHGSTEKAASPLRAADDGSFRKAESFRKSLAGGGGEEQHLLSAAGGTGGGDGPPFSVSKLRARSAGYSRSSGTNKAARGGRSSPPFDEERPPPGMGQLAMSLFTTGESPAALEPRNAFQPRRPAGLMTPGESTLTRQRPKTAAGRLTGSASSAGLLTVMPPSGAMRA